MLTGSKQRKQRTQKIINIILAILGVGFMSLIIYSPLIPENITLNVGDIASETVTSPRFIEIETEQDKQRTERLRQERADLVEKVYRIDDEVNKLNQAKIVSFFTELRDYQNNPNLTRKNILSFLSTSTLAQIPSKNIDAINRIEEVTLFTFNSINKQELYSINKRRILEQIQKTTKVFNLNTLEKELINAVILNFITPNMVFDENETQARVDQEFAAVKPFKTSIKESQPIIYKGEIVTKEHIDILKELKLYGVKANLMAYVGILCYAILMFILIERFMFYFTPKLHKHRINYLIIFVVSLIVLIAARFLLEFTDLQYVNNLHYLIPIPLVAMCISLLLSHNIAMIAGTITAIFITLMYNGNTQLFLYLFLSNCVATFSSYKIFKRYELIRSGYVIGLFNSIIILCLGLLTDNFEWAWLLSNTGIGFLNGLLSSMIALALLPYLESWFKITTSLALLEQAGLNHPLLKRLMMSAPGTYQHSIMVSNLAEAAAEAIEADSILVRIGAYFHDVGKIKRPTFFIENQFSGDNPHNKINPRMSKIIIAAHVKDGLDLADQYNLPKVLKTFIQEHHGTTMVSYFYSQAIQLELPDQKNNLEKTKEAIKEEFRYPGPKPKTKESGILMLADTVEAAVRSLNKPTVSKINNLIEDLIKEKIDDQQLSRCALSFDEIETIKKTFKSILTSVYHSRINYQEQINSIIGKQS